MPDRLIPARIDDGDVLECMQWLAKLERLANENTDPEVAAKFRAGRVVLERVLERQGDDHAE